MPRKPKTQPEEPKKSAPLTLAQWTNAENVKYGAVTDKDGDKVFGIPKGGQVYYQINEQPKNGDLVIVDLEGGWDYATFNFRPQLATVNGKRVETFKPLEDIRGVVKYVVQPVNQEGAK
jgi:hypothetical protein